MRSIPHTYRDPLDQIWRETARRVGLRIERSHEVNAATDGAGTLTLGAPDTLDADDCLAQMIFHELCHSLVEGEDSFARTDWGLDNQSDRDVAHEHACLRTQAVLAGRYGLRRVLAPTTEYREFYDALPADPLAARELASTALAIRALRRAERSPWAPHLGGALQATAAVAAAAAGFHGQGALLLGALDPTPAPHPSGLSAGGSGACGGCAWRGDDGVCLQAGAAVEPGWPGCERFEPPVDCRACGACCREGYDSVTVEADDPVVLRRPDFVVVRPSYLEIRRRGPRCAALDGDGASRGFRCVIYDDRPRCCRELEENGEHCLAARRRVGLSL